MIDIFVQRYGGDARGPDIVDPLITDIDVALSRGRAELGKQALLQQTVSQEIKFRTGVRLGQLVETHDAMQGVSWRGKITSISHKIDSGKVTTSLDIIRPVETF